MRWRRPVRTLRVRRRAGGSVVARWPGPRRATDAAGPSRVPAYAARTPDTDQQSVRSLTPCCPRVRPGSLGDVRDRQQGQRVASEFGRIERCAQRTHLRGGTPASPSLSGPASGASLERSAQCYRSVERVGHWQRGLKDAVDFEDLPAANLCHPHRRNTQRKRALDSPKSNPLNAVAGDRGLRDAAGRGWPDNLAPERQFAGAADHDLDVRVASNGRVRSQPDICVGAGIRREVATPCQAAESRACIDSRLQFQVARRMTRFAIAYDVHDAGVASGFHR
jgi:hypothetical protein